MSEDEFKEFMRQLYGSFPGLKEWVAKNAGADQVITHRAWYTTLKVCTHGECLEVLAGWLNGKFPVFEPYERDKIALVIRSHVMAERDKDARRRATGGSSEEYRKTRREDYRPLAQQLPELGKIFRVGEELREKWLKGEIDDAELRRRRQELVDQVK